MTDIGQFLKYIAVGGCAAITHLIILWLGVEYASLNEVISSFVGFCAAVIVNYNLQHRFVYKKQGGHRHFFKRYVIVTIIMQCANITLFWALITLAGIQYLVAQVMVIGVIFICNYIVNTQYTFRNNSVE